MLSASVGRQHQKSVITSQYNSGNNQNINIGLDNEQFLIRSSKTSLTSPNTTSPAQSSVFTHPKSTLKPNLAVAIVSRLQIINYNYSLRQKNNLTFHTLKPINNVCTHMMPARDRTCYICTTFDAYNYIRQIDRQINVKVWKRNGPDAVLERYYERTKIQINHQQTNESYKSKYSMSIFLFQVISNIH